MDWRGEAMKGARTRRIYVTEDAYMALVRYALRTRGTIRCMTEVASSLILEALEGERAGGEEPAPTAEAAAPSAPSGVSSHPPAPAVEPPPSPPPVAGFEEAKATSKQIDAIKGILHDSHLNWVDVKDLVEYEAGLILPDSVEDLAKREASKVIAALKEFRRKLTPEEVKEARRLMEKLPEEALRGLNLPERASDARYVHLVALRKAWSARSGGDASEDRDRGSGRAASVGGGVGEH